MTESEKLLEHYKIKEKPKNIKEGLNDAINLMVGLMGTTFIDVINKRKEEKMIEEHNKLGELMEKTRKEEEK